MMGAPFGAAMLKISIGMQDDDSWTGYVAAIATQVIK
jgi:hypothetical protein